MSGKQVRKSNGPGEIVVLKFGSSILRSESDLTTLVHEVYRQLRQGLRVIAVVSALKGATDELLGSLSCLSGDPEGELDSCALAEYLGLGEQRSVALALLALRQAGVSASSLDADGMGLITSGPALDGTPVALDCEAVRACLDDRPVLVLPGFVARDETGQPTLTGRGGSDLTAVYAASQLDAECVLLKDVPGVCNCDPGNSLSEARCYDTLTWADALSLGGKVIQERALQVAADHGVRLRVTSPGCREGTIVGAVETTLRPRRPAAAPIRVALLGLGTVGLGVYRHLAATPERFRVVSVAVRDRAKYLSGEVPPALLTEDAAEAAAGDCDLVVEVMGGLEPAAEIVAQALASGKQVVTANKALIARDGERLDAVAAQKGAKLYCGAAVGGAIPVLECLSRLDGADVVGLEGVVNGTTNFVLDRVAGGLSFDQAVRLAQDAGFAEADPTMDLDGTDAAQKLVVAARRLWGRNGFRPSLPTRRGLDSGIAGAVKKATGDGKVVRLVAAACRDRLEWKVEPQTLPADHPLASVKDEENCVLVRFRNGEVRALHGKGAGRWPTAEAVYADVADVERVTREERTPAAAEAPAAVETKPASGRWTELVRFNSAPGDRFDPASTPIYQTATFGQPDAFTFGEYDYTRTANPTRTVLQDQLARLQGARHALAFTSGMAATTAVTRLLAAGEEIIAGCDLYGGTHRLFSQVLSGQGVSVRFVDTTRPEVVAAELRPTTRLCWVETPSNPLQNITDIQALAEVLHSRGVLLVVDNTMMSPWLQKPLESGADVEVHSATKFLSGHGDLMAGTVATNDDKLAERIAFAQNAAGNGLAPFDSWLLLRGVQTLGLRVERAQANAEKVAQFLDGHPLVTRVHYCGLPGHPGSSVHLAQARGAGSVVSFETGSVSKSRVVVENTRLHHIAVSFGSLKSSISLPCRMSHASIPEGERTLPPDLVRISVGIEDAEDLIDDLGGALKQASTGASFPLLDTSGSDAKFVKVGEI